MEYSCYAAQWFALSTTAVNTLVECEAIIRGQKNLERAFPGVMKFDYRVKNLATGDVVGIEREA